MKGIIGGEVKSWTRMNPSWLFLIHGAFLAAAVVKQCLTVLVF